MANYFSFDFSWRSSDMVSAESLFYISLMSPSSVLLWLECFQLFSFRLSFSSIPFVIIVLYSGRELSPLLLRDGSGQSRVVRARLCWLLASNALIAGRLIFQPPRGESQSCLWCWRVNETRFSLPCLRLFWYWFSLSCFFSIPPNIYDSWLDFVDWIVKSKSRAWRKSIHSFYPVPICRPRSNRCRGRKSIPALLFFRLS